mgnify:CR=1 FL=1|jgi:hypothetical protein
MLKQLRLLRDVSALILIACTWRLWFAASDFPAIPFFSFLTTVPRGADQVLSGVLVTAMFVDACIVVGSLTHGSVSTRSLRVGQCCDVTLCVSAVCLILLNQQCLQPWMYHFLILTPLLWRQSSNSTVTVEETERVDTIESRLSNAFCRNGILWLTASIYVWSAWSKLDASFLESHGRKFVSAILDAGGLSTRFWSDRTWQLAAATLPIGELLAGVSLLFRRTRKIALPASVLMHLLLIVAVGPWGLDHRPGVILWNVFFIVQNVILFLAERRRGVTEHLPDCATPQRFATPHRGILFVTLAAIVFPVLRSVGCCDTWPAWAVYASSPARVLVQVRDDVTTQLPENLQRYVERRQINDGWSWLRIDLWSLSATDTPIYPEDRFQLGVARAVSENVAHQNSIRVIHESEADRLTGICERTEANGRAEIIELGSRFWLNSTPR